MLAVLRPLGVAEFLANPTQLWKTHAALGRLGAECKRPDLARGEWRAA
jgi:hypothetical protein